MPLHRQILQHRLWRLIVPVALLWLLVRLVDGPEVLQRLQAAQWPWLLAGLVLVQGQILLSARRWQFTAARLGCSLPWAQAVREYYLATLLNQILPGGVTGDIARVGRNHAAHGLASMGQSVVLERLAGQASLFVLTLAGAAAWPWLLHQSAPANGLGLLAITALLALTIVTLCCLAVRLAPPSWRAFLRGFGPAMQRAWLAREALPWQVVMSLAITLSYLALFAACALAIDAPLPLAALVTLVPLTLLTMLLPVSIGGWGLRESAASALWPLIGLSSEAGLATSLVYGLLCLIGALPGLYVISRGSLIRA